MTLLMVNPEFSVPMSLKSCSTSSTRLIARCAGEFAFNGWTKWTGTIRRGFTSLHSAISYGGYRVSEHAGTLDEENLQSGVTVSHPEQTQ